jgi:hypothetical protein
VTRKKKSCDLVRQAVAGPEASDVLEAIRAEYWLPARPRRHAADDTAGTKHRRDASPAQPDTNPKVKP